MYQKKHGKSMLCRVPKERHTAKHGFTMCQKKHTAKHEFAMCFFKLGAFVVAHGKVVICHVPDRKHTANNKTHCKFRFSGSVACIPEHGYNAFLKCLTHVRVHQP